MSYMTISSQEKHNFSLCSCFHAHPTTLLLKILGGDQCMGGPPTSNFFGGPSPSPPRTPPCTFPPCYPLFITAKTAFHHCTFSFITAHFVHHCRLKHAMFQTRLTPLGCGIEL